MLTYWERDNLLMKKAKTTFNNLSTKVNMGKRYKTNETHVNVIIFPASG